MITIGIQGAPGSFSEMAANTYVKKQDFLQYELKYLITSDTVVRSLNSGEIEYGVLAIENAQGGLVIESLYAIAQSQIHIVEMFPILIEQNLMILPGMSLDKLTAIHSHPQALRQCRNYLAKNHWGCTLVEADDTAESARRLQSGELEDTCAVIGNKNCAGLYGLQIISQNIHDLKENHTQFLVIKKYKG